MLRTGKIKQETIATNTTTTQQRTNNAHGRVANDMADQNPKLAMRGDNTHLISLARNSPKRLWYGESAKLSRPA